MRPFIERFHSACLLLRLDAFYRILPKRTIFCPISFSDIQTFPSFVSCPAFLNKDLDMSRTRHYAQCVSRRRSIRYYRYLCIAPF